MWHGHGYALLIKRGANPLKVNDIFVGDSTLYTITFFVYFSFAPKELSFNLCRV